VPDFGVDREITSTLKNLARAEKDIGHKFTPVEMI